MSGDIPKNKFLILGGSGLVGSEIANKLAGTPENQVYSFDLEHSRKLNERIIQIKGSATEEKDLQNLSVSIQTSPGELRGVVSCIAAKEISKKQLLTDISNPNRFNLDKAAEWRIESWRTSSRGTFEETISVNCAGPENLLKELFTEMSKSTSCSIVIVASAYGIRPPNQEIFQSEMHFNFKGPGYSVSKAALIAYTQYLATIMKGTQIRVNCVSPGAIENGQTEEFKEKYSKFTTANRMANVNDVVNAIDFLLSEKSDYMRGTNLVVDGGWSIL